MLRRREAERKARPPFFSMANMKEMAGLLLFVFLVRTFGFGLYQVPSGSMETTMLVGDRFFADKFSYLITEPKHGDIISFNDPTYNYATEPIKRLWQEYVWGPSNWTKRIIGCPGDEVEGKIEKGKPVVYVNEKKIEEHYVNPYPLIGVYKVDPSGLFQHMNCQILDDFWRHITFYSYDPNRSYYNQPFYRMQEDRIVFGADGKPIMMWPGTPISDPEEKIAKHKDENYWDGSDVFHVKLAKDQYWCMGDNRLGSKDCRCFGPINRRLIHGKIIFLIWSLDSDESWWIVDLLKHPIDFWSRLRWNRFFKIMH